MNSHSYDPHFVTNFIKQSGFSFPERTVRRWFSNVHTDSNWYPSYESLKYHRRALGDINEQLIGNDQLLAEWIVVSPLKAL